ncbi:hypothetical protein NDU88_004069 [Pleurodeles waltl]|uniref:Uncharacterized protein n=1 Tax=Pleurodeles waltl TaxID=8319 RepID=A0AAV7SHP5_PLEWA|nr:hypothetical protein NDU88_004069 [Pleurodeles waltl]
MLRPPCPQRIRKVGRRGTIARQGLQPTVAGTKRSKAPDPSAVRPAGAKPHTAEETMEGASGQKALLNPGVRDARAITLGRSQCPAMIEGSVPAQRPLLPASCPAPKKSVERAVGEGRWGRSVQGSSVAKLHASIRVLVAGNGDPTRRPGSQELARHPRPTHSKVLRRRATKQLRAPTLALHEGSCVAGGPR